MPISGASATYRPAAESGNHSSSPAQGPSTFSKSYTDRHTEGRSAFCPEHHGSKILAYKVKTLNYQMNFSSTLTRRKLSSAPSLLKMTSTGCHTPQELHKAIMEAHFRFSDKLCYSADNS